MAQRTSSAQRRLEDVVQQTEATPSRGRIASSDSRVVTDCESFDLLVFRFSIYIYIYIYCQGHKRLAFHFQVL